MTMEAKIKEALGEQVFAILALQAQVEQLQQENAELKKSAAKPLADKRKKT